MCGLALRDVLGDKAWHNQGKVTMLGNLETHPGLSAAMPQHHRELSFWDPVNVFTESFSNECRGGVLEEVLTVERMLGTDFWAQTVY